MRNLSFDFLKGCLVLLVIVGHVALGSVDENLLRSIIYFFHMPLFISLSGYFTKVAKFEVDARRIALEYWGRLIVPFLVAFVVYTLASQAARYYSGDWHFQGLVAAFLYPYYHLWYIPAITLFYVYTRFFYNFCEGRLRLGVVLSFLVALGLIAYSHRWDGEIFFMILGDKRFYYFYYFFILGHLLSRFSVRRSITVAACACFPAALYIYVSAFDYLLHAFGYLVCNSILVLVVLGVLPKVGISRPNFVTIVGRNSLPVYLWHVLIIVFVQALFLPNVFLYYIVSGFACLAFLFFVVFMNGKVSLFDAFFFGIRPFKETETTR